MLLVQETENMYTDSTRLFDDEGISKQCIVLSESVLSAVLTPDNECFIVPKKSQELYKITLPTEKVRAQYIVCTHCIIVIAFY